MRALCKRLEDELEEQRGRGMSEVQAVLHLLSIYLRLNVSLPHANWQGTVHMQSAPSVQTRQLKRILHSALELLRS